MGKKRQPSWVFYSLNYLTGKGSIVGNDETAVRHAAESLGVTGRLLYGNSEFTFHASGVNDGTETGSGEAPSGIFD